MNTTKAGKAITSIIALVTINFAYFLCMPYPKKLIATSFNNLVANLITDVIYSIIFCFLLTFLVSSISSKKLTKKRFLFEVLFYVFVRCIFDFIYIGTAAYISDKLFVVGNVLTVLLWVLLDLFNIKLFGIKTANPKKHFGIVLISSVILVVASVVLGFRLEAILNDAEEKYVLFSGSLDSVERSVDFVYQLVNMCIDCVASAVLIIAFSVSVEKTKDERSIEKNKNERRFSALAVISVFLTGAILLTGAKYVIAPNMTLRSHNVYSSECKNYPERIIGETKSIIEIRLFEGEEKTVFSIKSISVSFDDKTVLKKTCGFENEKNHYYISSDDNITVNLLNGGDILFYSEGDKYVALSADDLHLADEDDLILASCEYLLNNNVWFRFGEIAGYVLKYDKDFAIPLLERYSTGDFTDEETANECGVRTEYVRAISAALLLSQE